MWWIWVDKFNKIIPRLQLKIFLNKKLWHKCTTKIKNTSEDEWIDKNFAAPTDTTNENHRHHPTRDINQFIIVKMMMTTKSLCRVCWLCGSLANKFIAITAHSFDKYYCLYVSLCCLKSQKRNFYCPLMIFFAFKFLSLWIVTIADADSSSFLRNLLLTYAKFTQLWKMLLNEFSSQSNVFYQSDINDLNSNNLKFTTAYLTDIMSVWMHWTQFFK